MKQKRKHGPKPKQAEAKPPLVRFYRFIPGAREPQRADRSAAGSMPLRAFRYCEAMTTASAFGWYLFPPMSFSLMWDGRLEVVWTYEGADGWFPLKRAQFPDFAAQFDKVAPEDVRGYSPPFLGASTDGEPGLIQVWTGWAARTAPDWSLLIRPPANVPRSLGVESYEGIIESDRWFGPLFVNMRLIRTHAPIEFDADMPLLQVQPVHRDTYGAALDAFDTIQSLEGMNDADWDAFRKTVVRPKHGPLRHLGEYAAATRKRRKDKPAD
ncbi:MAG: hypothetical protein JO000_18590 [Alphaproteobacteria bacterium]|nr:hypothetical protein [Alphaproteobacteria bacterium]